MLLRSQCPRSQYHLGTFEDRLAIKFCAIQGSAAQVLKQYQDLDMAAASTPSVSFRLVSSYKMASALESAYVILAIPSHSELRPHPYTRPPECKTSIVSMPRRVSAVPHIHHDVPLLMIPVCYAALLGYEYLVHLPQEVELFWKRKITGASVLFFANRYLSLLAQTMQFIDPTSERVRHLHLIPH